MTWFLPQIVNMLNIGGAKVGMEDQILQTIGLRIREARENSDLTQEELAEKIGKTQKAISGYENGSRAIRVTELPALAKALDVPIAYFFGETINSHELVQTLYARLKPPFDQLLIKDLKGRIQEQENFRSASLASYSDEYIEYQRQKALGEEVEQALREQERTNKGEIDTIPKGDEIIDIVPIEPSEEIGADSQAYKLAYELYIDAKAEINDATSEEISQKVSYGNFVARIDKLGKKFSKGQLSLSTFAELLGIGKATTKDILKHTRFIPFDN
jgi:transcriptional regulator with XRE-family HTH domain